MATYVRFNVKPSGILNPKPKPEPESEPTDEFAKFIQDITEKAREKGVDFSQLLQPHTEPIQSSDDIYLLVS